MMTRRSRLLAFSLVEVTLALGVSAISLMAIFGLLATGTQVNHTAFEQTASTDLLTAVIDDLRAAPSTAGTSVQFGIVIPPNPVSAATSSTLYFDADDQSSTSLASDSRYRVVITFLPNSGKRSATLVNLRVSWPAAADPTNVNTGAAQMFVALDRN
ncbi:MAG TPA: hypothetical protein VGG02_11165 [Chthoniobacterales bacterium]|jgi:uncharacterized protein (TIGR02598 family)